MPEVWLNYGGVEVVADIRAENLGPTLEGTGEPLPDAELVEALSQVGLDDSPTLVILQDTPGVRQAVSAIHGICEKRSLPFPETVADAPIRESVKAGLPEGGAVSPLQPSRGVDRGMVFVAEVEPDGLFGYQTVCTRLLRRFGDGRMLDAYENRNGEMPSPGVDAKPYGIAKKFADQFEVASVEIVAGRKGITRIWTGHPSSADPAELTKTHHSPGARPAQSVLASTGKPSSNATLAGALPSLWNLRGTLKDGGQTVLLAECGEGLGSRALVGLAEGTTSWDDILKPQEYVERMEDALFLRSVAQETEPVLVSALPDFYAETLGIRTIRSTTEALTGMLRDGPRRKIALVPDAARTILGEYSSGDGGAQDG